MNKQRKRKRRTSADTNNFSFSVPSEVKKPINLIGLILIGFGLSLWTGYLFFRQKAEVAKEISVSESRSSSEQMGGLIDYAGVQYSEALVSSGLNLKIEELYPGLKLRFVEPLNQGANDISMLLDQEVSIVYSDRPLTYAELEKAKLRGIKLVQIPIAIDGIVFYGNIKSVSKISTKTAKAIFTGEIDNWQQIDPHASNLSITPVLLDKESLKSIGIDEKQATATIKYKPSYTEAVREVISTPGAVSFASASLVKDQQFINLFNLSDGGNTYVPPFVGGVPNTSAFKTGVYPLTRRLFFVYRQDDLIDSQVSKAIAKYLLDDDGQKVVQDSGFVRIK